ncbi:MAG TPA: hypothetical protein VKU77_00830 [Streptosporangiaceae bacterium]|nr:hypothetical protein [Streptosporangiaceae bacterium]
MDAAKLLDQVSENLSVRRAFGAAYEKDGALIIPVALVAGGGGGGTSRTGRRAAAGGPAGDPGAGVAVPGAAGDPGAGVAVPGAAGDPGAAVAVPGAAGDRGPMDAGGGFGGLVLPSGVYVVKGDQVRWVPAVEPTIAVLAALGLARLLVQVWTRRRR